MNCAVRSSGHNSFLVAGQESHCQLYHVNVKIDNSETIAENSRIETLNSLQQNNLRYRRISHDSSANRQASTASTNHIDSNQNKNRQLRFEIKPGHLTQTDFSENCPLQRVVRISSNCKYMATGGTDAHVRIWKFPNIVQIFDIDVHTKEVDDLDFSPDSKQLISIAKDGLVIVWDVHTGKECCRLKWTPPNNSKYLFKRCRFGIFEGKRGQNRLFTIANPVGKVGKQVIFRVQICIWCALTNHI